MSALAMVWRSLFRRNWRAWLALALAGGLGGGLVIATASAADRTNRALAHYVAASSRESVLVVQGFAAGDDGIDFGSVARLPQVEVSSRVQQMVTLVRSRNGLPVFPGA